MILIINNDMIVYTSFSNPMPSKTNSKKVYKDVKWIILHETSEDVHHNKKFSPMMSHTPQFVSEWIYFSLNSYRGTSVRIYVKFANEDGFFAPRQRYEKEVEDHSKAQKALEDLMKGMSN